MGELVVSLVSLFEIQVILQFCLMHFLLHILASGQGLFQLFRHPLPHLFLPLQLLLRHLNNRIKIYLHLFDKPQILLNLLVHLINPVVINSRGHSRLELALEIP